MFDELKSVLRNVLKEDKSLSIVPERKGITLNGELLEGEYLARNGFQKLALNRLGGMPSWSGEPVSNQSAMSLSVVYACVKIISETKGFLPINMMRTVGKYSDQATNHPLFNALRYEPNCEMTGSGFAKLLTSHCVLSGNAFAQIMRRSGTGTATELYPILPENVLIDREKTGNKRKVYVVKENGNSDASYTVEPDKPRSILHIPGAGWDGMKGYSVIHMARNSMGLALSQERNVSEFHKRGGRKPFHVETTLKWGSNQEEDEFRADMETIAEQPHMFFMTPEGVKLVEDGMSAKDAQLLESRQWTIPELCRWFGVSPHLVGDLSKATFSNVEALAEQFKTLTMQDWLTNWEDSLRLCLLTPDEKRQGYSFTHDLSNLLKANYTARLTGYATLLQNGVNSINEVRAWEGQNPIGPEGDEHRVQLNLADVQSEGANAGVIKQ